MNDSINCIIKCPICNSEMIEVFCKKNNKNLLICNSCRHLFWDRKPSQKDLQTYYSKIYSDSHSQKEIQAEACEYYISHIQELLAFTGLIPYNSTLVDYGSSYPILLFEAKKMGLNTIGVDWDSDCLKTGKRYGINMMTPDQFIYDIKNESIDIIRFSHVIEHMVNPLESIKEIISKLKFNGTVYITQPNFPVFLANHYNIEIKDSIYPEHLHFFSSISLIKLIEKCGLTIEKFFTHQNADEVFKRYYNHYDFKKIALDLFHMLILEIIFLEDLIIIQYIAGKILLYMQKK